jgi:hypothetical protein
LCFNKRFPTGYFSIGSPDIGWDDPRTLRKPELRIARLPLDMRGQPTNVKLDKKGKELLEILLLALALENLFFPPSFH